MRCPKTPSPAETLRPGSSRLCSRAARRGQVSCSWSTRRFPKRPSAGVRLLLRRRLRRLLPLRLPRVLLVGSSTTAADPAEPAPAGEAVLDVAPMELVRRHTPWTVIRPSETVRSTGGPSASRGPTDSCRRGGRSRRPTAGDTRPRRRGSGLVSRGSDEFGLRFRVPGRCGSRFPAGGGS
jgi:hypothetical protein